MMVDAGAAGNSGSPGHVLRLDYIVVGRRDSSANKARELITDFHRRFHTWLPSCPDSQCWKWAEVRESKVFGSTVR